MAQADANGPRMFMPSSRLMARSIGVLYTLGAILAIVWVELPHAARAHDRIVLCVAALALAGGVLLTTGLGDRLDTRWFHVLVAGVQVLIAVGYVSGADPANDLRLFFVWVAPVACFFFSPRAAMIHTASVAGFVAVALIAQGAPPGEGARIWLMTVGTVTVVGALVLCTAISVRHRERALFRAAHYDPLTGLANRMEFGRLAADMLARRETAGGRAVLFLADLDRFKTVNDTRGDVVGNHVLEAIATAIEAISPRRSIVARLGGDEFAVLIEDADGHLDTRGVADAISSIWSQPILLAEGAVRTSACLGVATSTKGDTPSSLLRDAESAMLRAKQDGPGTVSFFLLEQRLAEQRRYQIDQSLHDAARLGQLHLVFQPVVDIATGWLRACEVLLRWTHPDLGVVSPVEFISVAEDNGLIGPIGTWVLEQSIAQLGQWRASGIAAPDFRISVNVSGQQLHADLPVLIGRLLDEHGVPPEALMIELTETAILSASSETNETLRTLREMGTSLVLDDFGTGFSSLSHLQRARFDCVKIDRSFVDGVADEGTDRSIVSAILALASALDISVVAEGVETIEQADILKTLGCRLGQGYLFDRPLQVEHFTSRLARPTLRAVTGNDSAGNDDAGNDSAAGPALGIAANQ